MTGVRLEALGGKQLEIVLNLSLFGGGETHPSMVGISWIYCEGGICIFFFKRD